jgi:hypothetical protein
MIKYIILLLLLVNFMRSNAQHLIPSGYDTLVRSFEVVSHGVADYASTSLERGLVNKFFYGGEIDIDMKDRSFDRHGELNRFGFDIQAEAEFRNFKTEKFGKGKYGWLIRGGVYNYASLIYSRDLYGMSFYGNERYLGQEASFSGSRGSLWSMQKIGFGIIDKKTKSNISLNAYSIGAYAQGLLSNAYVYQSEEADSVFVRYQGAAEFMNADGMRRGWGLGIDAEYNMPLDLTPEKRIYIQFLVRNLGIGYLPEIINYSADSSLAFKGFSFDQIFGDSPIIGDDFTITDTLNVQRRKYSAFRFLPAFIQVGKIVDDHNQRKFQSFYGIRIYPSVVLIPHAYAGIQFKPVKWYATGVNLSYGAYGLLRFGWYSSINFKNWHVGVATENLYGTFSRKGLGESIVMRIQWRI